MNLPHSTVIGIVVRIVGYKRLVEELQILHFTDAPQFADAEPAFVAGTSHLNRPQNFVPLGGNAVAVRFYDAAVTAM
jgi:hypothetical protein